MPETMNLSKILDIIHENTDGREITVGDIIDALEDRGFGPLILASTLFCVPPLGQIPGFPVITAVLVILFAGQIIFGRKCPWVPKKLRNVSLKREKFEKAREKIEPLTRKFDHMLAARLCFLTSPVAIRVVALICIPLALLLIPMEFIPFGAIPPALAILIFALGISARDGLVILFGLAATAGTVALVVVLLP